MPAPSRASGKVEKSKQGDCKVMLPSWSITLTKPDAVPSQNFPAPAFPALVDCAARLSRHDEKMIGKARPVD